MPFRCYQWMEESFLSCCSSTHCQVFICHSRSLRCPSELLPEKERGYTQRAGSDRHKNSFIINVIKIFDEGPPQAPVTLILCMEAVTSFPFFLFLFTTPRKIIRTSSCSRTRRSYFHFISYRERVSCCSPSQVSMSVS